MLKSARFILDGMFFCCSLCHFVSAVVHLRGVGGRPPGAFTLPPFFSLYPAKPVASVFCHAGKASSWMLTKLRGWLLNYVSGSLGTPSKVVLKLEFSRKPVCLLMRTGKAC